MVLGNGAYRRGVTDVVIQAYVVDWSGAASSLQPKPVRYIGGDGLGSA